MFYAKDKVRKYVQRNSHSQKEYFPDTITPKKIRNSSNKKTFTFKKMQPLLNSNLKTNSKENSYIQNRIPKTSNDVMESNFTKSNNESFIIKTLSAEQLSQLESSRKLSYLENSEIKNQHVENQKNHMEEKKKEIDDSYFPNDLDNSFKHHNLVLKSFKQNLKAKLSQIKEEQYSNISDDTYILKNRYENDKKPPNNSFESIKANIERNNLYKTENLYSKKNSFENYIKDNISKKNNYFTDKNNNQKNLKKYKIDNSTRNNKILRRKRSVENKITKKKSYEKKLNQKYQLEKEFKIEKIKSKKEILSKKYEIKENTPFEVIRNFKFKKLIPKKKEEKEFKNLQKTEKFYNNKLIQKNKINRSSNLKSQKKNNLNLKFQKLTPKKEDDKLFNLKSNYDRINKKEFNNLESYLPLINNIETIVENGNQKETRTVTSIYYKNSEKSNSRYQNKIEKNLTSNSKKTIVYSNSKKNAVKIKNGNLKSDSKKLNYSSFKNMCSSVMTKDFKSPAKFMNKNENSNLKKEKLIKKNNNSMRKKSYSLTRENQNPIKSYNSPIKIKKCLNLQRNIKKETKKIVKSFSNDLKKKYSPIKKTFSNYKEKKIIGENNKQVVYRYFDKRNINKKTNFLNQKDDLNKNVNNFKIVIKNSSFRKKDGNFDLKNFSNSLKKISIKNKNKEVLNKKNSNQHKIFKRDHSTSNKFCRSRSNTPKIENFQNIKKNHLNNNEKDKIPELIKNMRDSKSFNLYGLNIMQKSNSKISKRSFTQNSSIRTISRSPVQKVFYEKNINRSVFQNSDIKNLSPLSVRRNYNKNKSKFIFKNSKIKKSSPLPLKKIYKHNKSNNSNISISPESIRRSYKNKSNKSLNKNSKLDKEKKDKKYQSKIYNANDKNTSPKINRIYQNKISKISPPPFRKIYNDNLNKSINNYSSFKNVSKNPIRRIYKNKSLNRNSKISSVSLKKRNTYLPLKKIYYNEKICNGSESGNSININFDKNNNSEKNFCYKKKITRIDKSPFSIKNSQNLEYENNYFTNFKKTMVKNENSIYQENFESKKLLTRNNSLRYVEKENMIQTNLSKIFNSKKKKKCNTFFNNKIFSKTFENLVGKKSNINYENKTNNPYETIFNKINNTDNNFENLFLEEKKNFNTNQNSIINSDMSCIKNKERIEKNSEYCYFR